MGVSAVAARAMRDGGAFRAESFHVAVVGLDAMNAETMRRR